MSSIKGFASKYLNPVTLLRHVTVKPTGHDKAALDVAPSALYPLGIAVNPASLYSAVDGNISNPDKTHLVVTSHGAREGDTIRFTSGLNISVEAAVEEIIDANTIRLGTILPNDIVITDDLLIMRAITLTLDSTGSLSTSSGPVQFILDGATQQVIEDTVTPANNAPLPVKLTGVTGDVNITAGDLNVQTSHLGASFDSQRIGDGTNVLGINASLEALVHDTDALAQLVLLVAKDFSTETTSSAILAKLIAAPATEAKQDTTITALGGLATQATSAAILAKIIAAPATEAKQDTLIAKDFATQTTLAALLAKVIAAPATEAKQDTEITALSDILAKIIAAPATEAKQDTAITAIGTLGTQATSAAILAKLIAAPSTEAKQDTLIAKDFATQTTLAAQSAKLPAALGQLAMAASMSVTLASDQSALEVNEESGNGGEPQASAIVGASVITFTAPANSIGFYLQADEANDGNVRWATGSTNPTASLGMKLLPGAGTGLINSSLDAKVIAESGTGHSINVHFITRT